MANLYVMVGLPASGKSTKAQKIKKENNNTIVVSSDSIRKELFLREDNQDNNTKVFETMMQRTREALNKDINVVYDATNLSSKRRIGLLKQFKNHNKICVFTYCSFYKCLINNSTRLRKVPIDVIKNMYKKIEIPMYFEGWNDIQIEVTEVTEEIEVMVSFKNLLDHKYTFDEYLQNLQMLGLGNCINLGQDSTYHSLSVDRHMYYSYLKSVELTDDFKTRLAVMFHDIGKPFCKNFKDGSKYANFTGHNSVGAYIMLEKLLGLGFPTKVSLEIAGLISLHMRFHSFNDSVNAKDKFKVKVGEDMFSKLEIIHKCDLNGH